MQFREMPDLEVVQSELSYCDFRSRGERDTAYLLIDEKRRGIVKRWQFEKHIDLIVNGKKVCEIWPDFLVEYDNGRLRVIEVKGGQFAKSKWWALKRELFKALYPQIEYTVKDTYFKNSKQELKAWRKKAKGWKPRVIDVTK